MRVLFTTQPALGHFHPLVSIAQELMAAGHEVAVACAASFQSTVETSGIQAFPAGIDWQLDEVREAFPELAGSSPEIDRIVFWRDIFAGRTAERMVTDLLGLAADWQPDVIVRENAEYGGLLAAESLGLPHALVQVASFNPQLDEWAGPSLDALRAQFDLPLDPDHTRLRGYLQFSFVPEAFQNAQIRLPTTYHSLRPAIFDQTAVEDPPIWLDRAVERPVVHVTLGTAFGNPALLTTIIGGLRDEVGTLVVSTARNVDPASLGTQPDNVRVERYIPHSVLLPQCDAIVTHGGMGTILASIVHGLPLVVTPITADQPANAELVTSLGLGRSVPRGEQTPQAIRDATLAVLNDPDYRRRVRELRDHLAALPGPDHAVMLLEKLHRDRAPLRGELDRPA